MINLNKDEAVVFVGGMNAMPMMYALELKKLGYNVFYIVDRPVSDTLSRPENHFSDITYPYPDWIIEMVVPSQILVALFPLYYTMKVNNLIKKKNIKVQVYILNGFFISLIRKLKQTSIKLVLSHGSDLDSWADIDGVETLTDTFSSFSIFKFLPPILSKIIIKNLVYSQFESCKQSNGVIYFPKGFNRFGDRVITRLRNAGVSVYERFDISFEPLKNEIRTFKVHGDKLVVFSGVRFTYKTFNEGNEGYSKGNDDIIKGLARFYSENKNLEVHLVEKGPDLEDAKLLCDKLGLTSAIIWHKEMKFIELLDLYGKADVCFDQVGEHWIGAIGGYALWLGRPLIANDEIPVNIGWWPKDNPIQSAKTAEDVELALHRLSDFEYRRKISIKSKKFVEEYMSPIAALKKIFRLDVN